MKKLFIVASLFATTLLSVNAQDVQTESTTGPIMSKRGYPILPEAGDWSLSINASSTIRFFGNLVSDLGSNNVSAFEYADTSLTPAVMVRKFIDANTAYRGFAGINFNSRTSKTLVQRNGGAATDMVENKVTNSTSGFLVGLGLEKRRGLSRVQGIYGAQAILGFAGRGTSYDYGNAIVAGENRTLKVKNGMAIMFAVQGFAGVEYFFAPKISLGGEFSWGPSIMIQGKGKSESEVNAGGTVTKVTNETGGASQIGLGLDNANGTIRLNFYF